MDGRIDGRMDGRMDGQKDGWKDEWMEVMDRWKDIHVLCGFLLEALIPSSDLSRFPWQSKALPTGILSNQHEASGTLIPYPCSDCYSSINMT